MRVPFLVVSTGVIMLTVCGVYQKMRLFRNFDHGKLIQGKPKLERHLRFLAEGGGPKKTKKTAPNGRPNRPREGAIHPGHGPLPAGPWRAASGLQCASRRAAPLGRIPMKCSKPSMESLANKGSPTQKMAFLRASLEHQENDFGANFAEGC